MDMNSEEAYIEHPVLDHERLIRVAGGSADLIQMLVSGFSTDIEKQMVHLEKTYAEHSAETQHACLHKMKGAVSNMGGTRLQHLLHKHIVQLRQKGTTISFENVEELRRETNELVRQLSEHNW